MNKGLRLNKHCLLIHPEGVFNGIDDLMNKGLRLNFFSSSGLILLNGIDDLMNKGLRLELNVGSYKEPKSSNGIDDLMNKGLRHLRYAF